MTDKMRHAFSIVELLVTTGMIVVVISLMMPALSQVRAEARKRVCQSEMRQLSMMITAYCGANDGRFPFYLERRADGNYEAPGGVLYTPVRATTIANYWPFNMFDEFGRSMYADVLLCPEDHSSLGDRARMASERGVPESEVQGSLIRGLNSSLYINAHALRQDMELWDDTYFQVNALYDAQFPSQKAFLVESEPLHEPWYYHIVDEGGDYIATWPAANRFHLMISAIDGSTDWRTSIDAVPGVNVPGLFRELLYESGMSAQNIELNIQHTRRPSYFTWTRDGIRGRDW